MDQEKKIRNREKELMEGLLGLLNEVKSTKHQKVIEYIKENKDEGQLAEMAIALLIEMDERSASFNQNSTRGERDMQRKRGK